GPGGPGGPGTWGPRRGRSHRAPDGGRFRKAAKITGLAALAALLLGFGLVGIVYARTDVPNPNALKTNQVATIYYQDGKTVLARIGSRNRSDVPLSAVPTHVRWAVLAAENRSFYTDPGISPKGITRAAWNNLRGGELQGGSTITQQYVKNVFTSGERTFKRKFDELFVTVKLDRQYSKDQILEWYLNTIYFGRGAYGVQAAAQVYFGKPVSKLTLAEGAVLAASIRSPAFYDPQAHPAEAKERWRFVLNGMVEMDKLAAAEAAAAKYPKVRPKSTRSLDDARKTWAGHIVRQVTEELEAADFDEARLNSEGLSVVTTIDKKAQDAAVAAVREVFANEKNADPDEALRQALVAVQPSSGKVLAYWGGPNGLGVDYAQVWRQPGSSFKPYVLATALQQTLDPETPDEKKVSVYKTYDGTSPRTFPGLTKPVRNSEDAQCPNCPVLEAMRRSINTVFYQMALDVGPENIAALAHKLGVPKTRPKLGGGSEPSLQQGGETKGGIGIGQYEVRTIDQAVGFSVFASGGVLHRPYMVDKVRDNDGNDVYVHADRPQQVLDEKVANDVTYALKPVAEHAHDPLAGGRESAAKTGTQGFAGAVNENSDAWMVGFTPQVSAAVWVGSNKLGPLRTSDGRLVYGSGLPGKTWQAFMDRYLDGVEQVELTDDVQVHPELRPAPPVVVATASPQTRSPEPSPTPSPTRTSAKPTPAPRPTKPPKSPTPSPIEPAPTSASPTPTPTSSPTRPRPAGI
ncbi:MAG TPA: transglycosylase domain-containing protein, partial [Mycobacteriales bacterium]|nr:transglycosylase domain-containing protein [Mycobacteriales bacterium]